MNITQAKKEARNRVSTYRQGDGWVLSIYMLETDCWHTSIEDSYWSIRAQGVIAKNEIACGLMKQSKEK